MSDIPSISVPDDVAVVDGVSSPTVTPSKPIEWVEFLTGTKDNNKKHVSEHDFLTPFDDNYGERVVTTTSSSSSTGSSPITPIIQTMDNNGNVNGQVVDFFSRIVSPLMSPPGSNSQADKNQLSLPTIDYSSTSPIEKNNGMKSDSENIDNETRISTTSIISALSATSHASSSSTQWTFLNRNNELQHMNVKVSIRVRPFLATETGTNNNRRIVSFKDNKLVIVNPVAFDADPDAIAQAAYMVRMKEWAQVFRFSNCIWSFQDDSNDLALVDMVYSNQTNVHSNIGKNIVSNVMNGITSTCITYGTTASGKTYTLFGNNCSDTEDMGLIPRVYSDIITQMNVQNVTDTNITLSVYELYNDKIKDIMNFIFSKKNNTASSTKLCNIREHPVTGPYVEGLEKVHVTSIDELLLLLEAVRQCRTCVQTPWDSKPNYSTCVIVLELTPNLPQSNTNNSKFTSISYSKAKNGNGSSSSVSSTANQNDSVRAIFVDLPGSEKISAQVLNNSTSNNSTVNAKSSTPKKMMSTSSDNATTTNNLIIKDIRQSLSTLGMTLNFLCKGGDDANNNNISYRDSRLTWILKDALNMKNFVHIIGTLSPSSACYDESLHTLKYLERFQPSGDHTVSSPAKQTTSDQFNAINHKLGADKTGTPNARSLLRTIVSDPQQRIAKIKTNSYITSHTNHHSSQHSELLLDSYSSSSVSPLQMLNTERDTEQDKILSLLSEKISELQMELDYTKIDRDNLLLELKAAKDTIDDSDLVKVNNTITIGTSNVNIDNILTVLKNNEKEVVELKDILTRKNETIERLLNDLQDESISKNNLKTSHIAQSKEFVARLEALQKQVKSLQVEAETAKINERIVEQEKNSIAIDNEKLTATANSLRDSLVDANKQLKNTLDINGTLCSDIETCRALQNLLEKQLIDSNKAVSDANEVIERLSSNVNIITSEKNTLLSIIEQQETAIKVQQTQSENSLKMLHQRQMALERMEQDYNSSMEELLQLHDSHQGLLTREGQSLYTELLDAKRLTGMITSFRDKIENVNILKKELDTKDLVLKETERNYQLLLTKYNEAMTSNSSLMVKVAETTKDSLENLHKLDKKESTKVMELTDELTTLKRSLAELQRNFDANEAKALYWQQVATKVTGNKAISVMPAAVMNTTHDSTDSTTVIIQLQREKNELLVIIDSKDREIKDLNEQLGGKKEAMQKEYSSLWLAVQELNKLDVIKEKAMLDLVEERNKAIQEKSLLDRALKELSTSYNDLQDELESVDRDLLAAVEKNNPKIVFDRYLKDSVSSNSSRYGNNTYNFSVEHSAATPTRIAYNQANFYDSSSNRHHIPTSENKISLIKKSNIESDELLEKVLESQVNDLNKLLRSQR